MKMSELKGRLFEQFSHQCDQLQKKRVDFQRKVDSFQRELDQDLVRLREAYGLEVLNGLGQFSLQPTTSEASAKTKTVPGKKKSRAKHTPAYRENSIAKSLAELLPAVISKLVAAKTSFRALDAYKLIEGKVNCTLAYFSMFIAQNAERFGLAMEKRKTESSIGKVNYFRLKGTSAEETRPVRISGERWKEIIKGALKDLPDGLTLSELWEKIRSAEVTSKKAMSRTTKRMRDKGLLSLEGGRYRWIATAP